MMSAQRHHPRDRGVSFIEILVAVVILGIGGVAVLGGVGTTAKGTSVQRQAADAQTMLASGANAVSSASPNRCPSDPVTHYQDDLSDVDELGQQDISVEGVEVQVPDTNGVLQWTALDCANPAVAAATGPQKVTLVVQLTSGAVKRLTILSASQTTATTVPIMLPTTTSSTTTTTLPGSPTTVAPSTTSTSSTTTTVAPSTTPIGNVFLTTPFSMIGSGDVTISGTQVYGALAVGGNLSFTSSGPIAANSTGTLTVPGATSNVGLLVNGKVNLNSGVLYVNNGASAVIGDMSNGKYTAPGGTNCFVLTSASQCTNPQVAMQGGGNVTSSQPFDFVMAYSAFVKTSTAFAALPGSCANAATAIMRDQNDTAPWSGNGNFVLKLTSGKTNVLNISAAQVSAMAGSSAVGASVTATSSTPLIINVTDSGSVNFTAPNFPQNYPRHVVWNFPNASSVTFSNALWGSLYAPNAAVVVNADVRGVVIGRTIVGNGGVADWSLRPDVSVNCTRST